MHYIFLNIYNFHKILDQWSICNIATLGLSWNLSLAEDLESLSLQDGPLSGIIFGLDPTHQPDS